MKIEISDNLRSNLAGAYAGEGIRWLDRLPEEVADAAQRWGLWDITSFPEQSFNFVATAKEMDGRPVFLKIGLPSADSRLEAGALEAFAGRGMVKLLKCDKSRGWVLLERLDPGKPLVSLAGEEKRIEVAAGLAKKIWSAPRELGKGWPHIRKHFGLFELVLPRPGIKEDAALSGLVKQGRAVFDEIQDDAKDCLLHGDLHHFNILSHGGGWLAIDAKGVVGNPLYDIGAYLLNPMSEVGKPGWEELTALRVKGFAKSLNEKAPLVAKWGFAVAVLRALWTFDLGLPDWKGQLRRSAVFQRHF